MGKNLGLVMVVPLLSCGRLDSVAVMTGVGLGLLHAVPASCFSLCRMS